VTTEKPILFSTEMVQAILTGSKTMTRRVVNPQPELEIRETFNSSTGWADIDKNGWAIKREVKCPYGKPGDLLWVRETWRLPEFHEYDAPVQPEFKAGHDQADELKWKPSIHMKKEHCRIWLKVTGVRVERLQDITENDVIKEGVEPIVDFKISFFKYLWDSLNGKPRGNGRDISWAANPWVWVVEFERAERPQAAKD